jgi:hypothetical protein
MHFCNFSSRRNSRFCLRKIVWVDKSKRVPSETRCFHGGKYEVTVSWYGKLCSLVVTSVSVELTASTFRALFYSFTQSWKKQVHSKPKHRSRKLHGITCQKILIFKKGRTANWFFSPICVHLFEPLEENNIHIILCTVNTGIIKNVP